MRLNMADALDKAERSVISDAEIKEVIYRLESLVDKPNLEYLLTILGASKRFEYRKTLEKFLIYPDDPKISAIALEMLIEEWGMAKHYATYIKEMMRGAEWDENQYVRRKAILYGSYYFQEIVDKEILRILLDIIENKEEDLQIGGEAYEGILYCLGYSTADIFRYKPVSKYYEGDIDPKFLAEAYTLLNKKN